MPQNHKTLDSWIRGFLNSIKGIVSTKSKFGSVGDFGMEIHSISFFALHGEKTNVHPSVRLSLHLHRQVVNHQHCQVEAFQILSWISISLNLQNTTNRTEKGKVQGEKSSAMLGHDWCLTYMNHPAHFLRHVYKKYQDRKMLESLGNPYWRPCHQRQSLRKWTWFGDLGVSHLVKYFHIPVYTTLLQKAEPCSLARCEYCQRFSCLLPVSPDAVEAEENNTKKSKKSERMEECFTNRAISSGPFCDDRIPLKFHCFWKSVT